MSAWFRTKLIGFRVAGYDVLRIVLGSILIVAAGLKCYQLGSGPVAESGLLTSRWFLIVVVEFEFLFALCLLVGVCRHLVWMGAVACFAVFACVSCYKAVSGDASCGCFGAVRVSVVDFLFGCRCLTGAASAPPREPRNNWWNPSSCEPHAHSTARDHCGRDSGSRRMGHEQSSLRRVWNGGNQPGID